MKPADPHRTARLFHRWHSADSGPARADAAHRLAVLHREQGDATKAERFAREAVRFEERGDRPAILGNHLMFLASLVPQQADASETLALLRRALTCYEAAHGPDHREVAYVLSVLARHYTARGLEEEARGYRARHQRTLDQR